MTDPSTKPPTEQLLRVAPGDLVISDNIRKTVKLDPDFVKSIKQHGVVLPILVEPGENGIWNVIDGQLRTLAALDTGRPDVPIITEAQQGEADRLIRQLAINDHRAGIIDADRAATYQTLFNLGVSADSIARKTNVPKKRVEVALAVAGSRYATEVLESGNVTLDQAAAIVEFEDAPDVAEALTNTALSEPTRFDHLVARARAQRSSDNARVALIEQLEQERYVVTDEFKDPWVCNPTVSSIDYLYKDEAFVEPLASSTTQRLTPFDGLKAIVRESYEWDNKSNRQIQKWAAHFVVDGWQELGYHVQKHRLSADKPAGGGLTDQQKEERRETRENNKLWGPATEVRRTWIKELLQRKELPSGWEIFVARFVVRGQAEHNYSFEMILLEASDRRDGGAWLQANPTRAAHYLIASAIASIEGSHEFSKDGWRHHLADAYIAQLSRWGYTLSELEESVAKKASK